MRGGSARNRWFDKGTTLVVESNTRAGMMGEHSPVDALVPSIVADYSLAEDVDPEWTMDPLEETGRMEERWGERLEFVMDERVRKECARAEERAAADIMDSDDDVHWFTGDRKSTRLNSSHSGESRMPSSA